MAGKTKQRGFGMHRVMGITALAITILLAPVYMVLAVIQTAFEFVFGGWKAIKEE